jgi:prevent-host-death family protein
MKTVSASDANRNFSALLREVSRGEVVTVVSRGKPVATIAPAGGVSGDREAARARLARRLRHQQPSGTRGWSRDELYDPV